MRLLWIASLPRPWKNKFAIVSGASSGLGLNLALALAEQGARLAILGRDPVRLEASRQATLQAGAEHVEVLAIDLLDEASWNQGSEEIARLRSLIENQPIDLLVNVVGRSDRGMLEHLTPGDLMEQFRVNVLSTFRMTQTCLPGLKLARGTVVDIASLAGILAGPGMGAYSLSKHALVGMHRQWRLELPGNQVHFLLVCPGPILRDGGDRRYVAMVASRNLEENMARPGGGVRLKGLDAAVLARRILDAAARRELELIEPSKARWLAALMPVWPSWADRILRNRFK
jgi:NAD(P)-dependent dehydrogenase (short-subunit alcohol dehydrogenase family)